MCIFSCRKNKLYCTYSSIYRIQKCLFLNPFTFSEVVCMGSLCHSVVVLFLLWAPVHVYRQCTTGCTEPAFVVSAG